MADDFDNTTRRDPGVREHDTVERTTTIIDTDRGRGGGGALTAVLLVIAILALLFLFRDSLGFGGTKTEIKVPDKIDVNLN